MITCKIDTSNLKLKLADLKNLEKKAMPILEDYFVKETPIATGNARANTSLQGNKIVADYQYAAVLDAGRGYRDGQMRGSNQAPQGMSGPTREYAKKLLPQLIKQIWGRRK